MREGLSTGGFINRILRYFTMLYTQVLAEVNQISKTELLAKIDNVLKPLIIFSKRSILNA